MTDAEAEAAGPRESRAQLRGMQRTPRPRTALEAEHGAAAAAAEAEKGARVAADRRAAGARMSDESARPRRRSSPAKMKEEEEKARGARERATR